MQYEPVIGLEVHVQLKTQSKIFSGASTHYGAPPNTQVSAIDLGLPGVLPVLNKTAVTLAIRLGLGIHGTIAKKSIFARKNYFYPDLPKGYQITQYETPIISNGYLDISLETDTKRIGITRAHLEEDAGKSIHDEHGHYSGIDLNRAGTPLLEIVSEPQLRSPKEAVAYLKTLHNLIRSLDVSEANMQEGSFRCDVNISLRPLGQTAFGTRIEIKNLNSFRFVERALIYEIDRQHQALTQGRSLVQETRLYDPVKDETRSMRLKEKEQDYRYLPDPDLLVLEISEEWIAAVQKTLPELPDTKRKRFETQYGLSSADAAFLTHDSGFANYFEKVLNLAPTLSPKMISNWIAVELTAALNKNHLAIEKSPMQPDDLATLLSRIADNTLSNSAAKVVFEALWNGEKNVDHIIIARNLKQMTDTGALESVVQEIIDKNPSQVAQYRAGKEKLLAFFVGQAMGMTKGRADPARLTELFKRKLSE